MSRALLAVCWSIRDPLALGFLMRKSPDGCLAVPTCFRVLARLMRARRYSKDSSICIWYPYYFCYGYYYYYYYTCELYAPGLTTYPPCMLYDPDLYYYVFKNPSPLLGYYYICPEIAEGFILGIPLLLEETLDCAPKVFPLCKGRGDWPRGC